MLCYFCNSLTHTLKRWGQLTPFSSQLEQQLLFVFNTFVHIHKHSCVNLYSNVSLCSKHCCFKVLPLKRKYQPVMKISSKLHLHFSITKCVNLTLLFKVQSFSTSNIHPASPQPISLVATHSLGIYALNATYDFWYSHTPETSFTNMVSQLTKTFGSMSIRHRSDTKVSDRCLIDVDPKIFAIWIMRLGYGYVITSTASCRV